MALSLLRVTPRPSLPLRDLPQPARLGPVLAVPGAAALGLMWLARAGGAREALLAPLLAIALMSAGMIGAALAGRLRAGFALALASAAVLAALAYGLGLAQRIDLDRAALAFVLAAISFAARGALFARSAGARGWWIALAVVAGEGALLITAAFEPGALPGWLMALLPAQWASSAILAALGGTEAPIAGAALLALAGTAAATRLVERCWPARWPYGVMLATWLGCSAIVGLSAPR